MMRDLEDSYRDSKNSWTAINLRSKLHRMNKLNLRGASRPLISTRRLFKFRKFSVFKALAKAEHTLANNIMLFGDE